MPARDTAYRTVEEVLAFPHDGKRYELAYGRLLVSPAPSLHHQRIVMRLSMALMAYCEREEIGECFGVAADLTWGRQDILTQPDVFVLSQQDAGAREWAQVRHVLFVAEVLSPSTRRHDRFEKRRVYQEHGVNVCWLIDPELGQAEVWTPEAQLPSLVTHTLTWQPEGASTPYSIALPQLLAP